MSEQESINTLTTKVGEIGTELEGDVTTIQAELDKLATEVAAGQPVNLEALTTAVDALAPKAEALGKLTPA